MRMRMHILTVVFFATSVFAQNVTWKQTSGPVGGSIRDIASNGRGDLFALDAGSLFSTGTDQIDWHSIRRDISATMTVIAVTSTNTLFVGTDRRTGGIFRSTDTGDSWVQIYQGLADAGIIDLQVNCEDEILVVVPRRGQSNNMILKSTDSGETWQTILDDSTQNWGRFGVLAINSQDHLFVGTNRSGILRSTDGGANWTQINTGLDHRTINDFAIAPNGVIFVGTWVGGVYRSRDNGDTWETANVGLPEDRLTIRQIESNSKGELFAAAYGSFYVSRNAGDLWTEVTGSEFLKYATYIFVDQQDGIYVGTQGNGIIYSEDDDLTWHPMNQGMANARVSAFVINGDDALIAGTSGGLSISENGGDSWQQIEQNLSSRFISHMAESPNGTIFTGSGCPGDNNQFMLRSLDNGYTWTEMTHMQRCVLSLVVDYDGDVLISTSFFINGIYRSQDNGDTWEQLDPDLVAETMAVNQKNNIFAGTGNGLYRWSATGQTWDLVQTPLQKPWAEYLFIDTEDNIFVELFDYPLYGLYRSKDGGLTWDLLALGIDDTTGLQPYGFNLYVLYQDGGDNLWAGTSEGVYYSPDQGDTWQLVNDGLEEIEVCSFDMNSEGILFAGTCGDGIFRSSASVLSVESRKTDRPVSFRLEQNYPNPFNPGTTIRYQTQNKSHVNLSITNIVGQKIRTLVNQDQKAGLYNIRWDGKDDFGREVASGVYFYRLTSGSFVTVKRLLLIR